MKEKIILWIRNIIFMAGLVVVVFLCDFLFAQHGYIRYILQDVNNEQNNYDGIILGASHARSAIDPQKIDNYDDTNTLSLAIPNETLKDSVYVLEEACNSQNIKRVILDVDYQYWFIKTTEGYYNEAFIYNQMSWESSTKWKYLFNNLENLDIRNAFSQIISYDVTPETVVNNVKQKTSQDYRDGNIYSLTVGDANGPYVGKGFFSRELSGGMPGGLEYVEHFSDLVDDGISDYAYKYFEKLKEYCDSKGIELICVTSPITPSTLKIQSMDRVHDIFKEYFDSKGVTYLDFNMARLDVLPRTDYDYGDMEGHMGGEPAERYSEVLGQVLKKYEDKELDMNQYFYSTFDELYKELDENKSVK